MLLYTSEGHYDDVEHEYTYCRIRENIDDRIREVAEDVKRYCYCSYDDSFLESDFDISDELDTYLQTLSDEEFIARTKQLVADTYDNGMHHTTSVDTMFNSIDLDKYYLC